MKKNVGISICKCLKSVAKNRRANQMARAILSAPTVQYRPTPDLKVHMHEILKFVFHIFLASFNNRQG